MFTDPNEDPSVIKLRPIQPRVSVPIDPTDEELALHWTLSEKDICTALKCRGNENRIRFAAQICVVQQHGRFLDDYGRIPAKILAYLGSQLEILIPTVTLGNPERENTEFKYRSGVCDYLGFQQFSEKWKNSLANHIDVLLRENLFNHDIVDEAEKYLLQYRIILPSPKEFSRLINSFAAKAEQQIFADLSQQIPEPLKVKIDEVLDKSEDLGTSDFFRFSCSPPEAKAKKIAEYIQTHHELEDLGISDLRFSGTTPQLLRQISKTVNTYDVWRIKRFHPEKRYALAACFLLESQRDMLDNLVRMHSQFVADMEREARNAYENELIGLRKKSRNGFRLFQKLGEKYVFFANAEDKAEIYDHVDPQNVANALESVSVFNRFEAGGFIDKLSAKYPNFRKYFREGIYVLSGLVDSNATVEITQHHTDSGGYTDQTFALSYLLGYSFMPHLKNLHKRRLSKLTKDQDCDDFGSMFERKIDLDLIAEQWDPMIRIASSIQNRVVSASLISDKLINRKDRLGQALRELGRLLKTIFVMRYIQDEPLRRQVRRQLNRGEQRHGLAKYIFFANSGVLRSGSLKEIMSKATCLSLLSNAIVIWNTVEYAKILKNLGQQGFSDEILSHVTPMMHKHIIVNGTYNFFGKQQVGLMSSKIH